MADENLEAGENTEVITEGTPSAPQMSDVEIEARESGWVPESEYTGDKNKWVDAAEFVRRGPLFKKIDSQSREIKAMRQAIADIQALHEKSREAEYKKALAEVRAEKKAALLDGDADAVIEADEKLDMLREAQRETPRPTEAAGEAHPEFVAWVSKNTWYESHKGMKAFADTVGAEYRAQGMSPSEVLKAVERDVRKEFPNRFVNPNQSKPGAVEGSSNAPANSGGGKDNIVLSDTERSIMNNLVRLGVMTQKEYIAELKKTREV